MQLFYDPDLQPGVHQLREAEARHAFQVLRKREGDVLNLVDGKGGWFRAVVTDISKRACVVEAKELRREAKRAQHELKLYVAPTKSIDR
ncbi:MAG: RNA methyltransferase PUA domain-containing protein, partial [Bacteroidota bacterium]